MTETSARTDFWKNGLLFSCTRCSACCRHQPGYVFLSVQDIQNLLLFFKFDFRKCVDTVLRAVDIGSGFAISLKEKPNNDCILWDGGCTAYDLRPVQCSTYPFWSAVLRDSETWREEAAACPGIGESECVPSQTIEEALWHRRAHPPVMMDYGFSLETIDEITLLGR